MWEGARPSTHKGIRGREEQTSKHFTMRKCLARMYGIMKTPISVAPVTNVFDETNKRAFVNFAL